MRFRRIFTPRSVGSVVVLTLICVNTLVLSLLGYADFREARQRLDDGVRMELSDLADHFAGDLSDALGQPDPTGVFDLIEDAMSNKSLSAMLVLDHPGGDRVMGKVRDANWQPVLTRVVPDPGDDMVTRRTITAEGKTLGTLELRLTRRFVKRNLSLGLARIVTRIFLVNLVLAAALVLVLRRLVIKPLSCLERYAARINAGSETDEDSCDDLPGEMGSLGGTMEAMVKRLRSARREYRDLFENTTEGVFQSTVDGRFLRVNRSMATMLGYAGPRDLVHSVEDVSRQVYHNAGERGRLLERLQTVGVVTGFQTRFVRRDGQLLWVMINARLVPPELERPALVEGTVTDITSRVRAERRLASVNRHLRAAVRERTERLAVKAAQLEAANERLTELDRLKSGFLATVSHDLRTPLTSIMGFAKLISRDFTKYFSRFATDNERLGHQAERLLSNVGIIENEGARLTRLINDFLDLSKIEAGRAEWRDAPVDPARIIIQAVDALSGDVQAKPDIRLDVAVPERLPQLCMDQDRLSQVALNLLSNAIKFTDQGMIRVWAGVRDERLRLEVSDTGQGVPRDSLEKIFDKFHQAEVSDTLDIWRQRKGTGLGLAICRQIVEHYRGRIWVESEVGQGSTFIVELPIYRSADASRQILFESGKDSDG